MDDLVKELLLLDLLTLRIDLERKLARLAEARGLESKRESIGMLATNLHLHEFLSTELLHNIMLLSRTLNEVVQGENLTVEQARHSLETGRMILAKLDNESSG
jgi:hypothetical protein